MTDSSFPRWSLALTSGLVAAVCGWAAFVLPWRDWTTFSIVTAIMAVVHLATAGLAALDHPFRGRMWRVQSVVALTFLGYLTWNLLTSALYIAQLYGGLGKGVAVSLGLVWTIAAFMTVPLSAWGLALTGGVRPRRGAKAGAGVAGLLAIFGLVWAKQAAAADAVLDADETAALSEVVANALPPVAERRPLPPDAPSLMTDEPAVCEQPPDESVATIVATYLAPGVAERPEPVTRCFQAASLQQAAARLHERLEEEAFAGPIKVDVVTATQPLRHVAPVVDSLTLRAGLDGVCEQRRCAMPWKLLALDQFNVNTPIPVIRELRFGFDPVFIRKILAEPERRGLVPTRIEGLVRIETASFVSDDENAVHRLYRMRRDGPPLGDETLSSAIAAAERYILSAQASDGRFEYKLDPFSGRRSFQGFSLARQAGTTLVICELARDRETARRVATDALQMLVDTQRKHSDFGALYYPAQREVRFIGLGDTALSAIALLSCRDLVGGRFDADIDRMTRFLLHMQRPDGSFYPRIDMTNGEPVAGPDPLYAVGQAVFALTLLEDLTADPAQADGFADHEALHGAVERAMDYIAGDYWSNFAADFFFMEENWHCLAARASLGHHRHDGYERFCLDYVEYKKRLILDEESRVGPDFVGGYGFGNVLFPHNTGSAGFGEAMAAALAIKRVRQMDTRDDERVLRLALSFLLHHQWDETSCFACTSTSHPVVGGFSEHMASPTIRIDYVQHAMAGMGHGGYMLGLWDGPDPTVPQL